MEQGIFTRAQEVLIGKLLKDFVKLKGILGFFSGYFFEAIIRYIDDTFIDKLESEMKAKLAEVVVAVENNNVQHAQNLASALLAELVKIPWMTLDVKKAVFKAFIELILSAILNWIEKKKNRTVVVTLA